MSDYDLDDYNIDDIASEWDDFVEDDMWDDEYYVDPEDDLYDLDQQLVDLDNDIAYALAKGDLQLAERLQDELDLLLMDMMTIR